MLWLYQSWKEMHLLLTSCLSVFKCQAGIRNKKVYWIYLIITNIKKIQSQLSFSYWWSCFFTLPLTNPDTSDGVITHGCWGIDWKAALNFRAHPCKDILLCGTNKLKSLGKQMFRLVRIKRKLDGSTASSNTRNYARQCLLLPRNHAEFSLSNI